MYSCSDSIISLWHAANLLPWTYNILGLIVRFLCILQQPGGLKPDATQTMVGNGLQALQLQPGGVLTPILPPAQTGAPTFLPVTASGVSIQCIILLRGISLNPAR